MRCRALLPGSSASTSISSRINLSGWSAHNPAYTEIPTIESSLSALTKSLKNLPLAEIADKVVKTLDGIEKLVKDPNIKETLASLHQTVDEAHALLRNVDGQVKPLATSTELTLSEAKKLFANAAQLALDLESRIPQLIASLESTSREAGSQGT